MLIVSMVEAELGFSRLVARVESGAEAEIVIARNGRPAVRLVPIAATVRPKRRLGLLVGQYPATSQEEFDADNTTIARLFEGDARTALP